MATMKVGTEEVQKIMYGTEEVSSLAIGEETIPVDGGGGSDYSKMPFTVEALSDGDLALRNYGNVARVYNYSINGGASNSFEFTSGSIVSLTIPLKTGDVVEFTVASDQNGTSDSSTKYVAFTKSTCEHKVYGNIMSLVFADFQSATTLPSNYCFNKLFQSASTLVDAENLILPATTLASNCYQYMFKGCTSLTKAPDLPATEVESNCYNTMFKGCTSLTKAPDLPATTLAINCYAGMFEGCTGLVSAPSISATTLAGGCYSTMFKGCTSLTAVPELPTTELENNCYQYMFQGCTSLTAAPELPATAMKSYCYAGMFSGCTSLNYVKCLAGSTSSSSSFEGWLVGVSATGTFVKAAGVTWPTGTSGIPDGWTVENA